MGGGTDTWERAVRHSLHGQKRACDHGRLLHNLLTRHLWLLLPMFVALHSMGKVCDFLQEPAATQPLSRLEKWPGGPSMGKQQGRDNCHGPVAFFWS